MYACITGALTGSPTCWNALRNFGNKMGDSISISCAQDSSTHVGSASLRRPRTLEWIEHLLDRRLRIAGRLKLCVPDHCNLMSDHEAHVRLVLLGRHRLERSI